MHKALLWVASKRDLCKELVLKPRRQSCCCANPYPLKERKLPVLSSLILQAPLMLMCTNTHVGGYVHKHTCAHAQFYKRVCMCANPTLHVCTRHTHTYRLTQAYASPAGGSLPQFLQASWFLTLLKAQETFFP